MQCKCAEYVLQEQYIFVYDALLEALKAGKTVIGCSQFKSEFDKLCAVDHASGKLKLQQQFEVNLSHNFTICYSLTSTLS